MYRFKRNAGYYYVPYEHAPKNFIAVKHYVKLR